MHQVGYSVIFLLLLVPGAWAGSPFAGTFIGPEDEKLVLSQNGSRVSGSVATDQTTGKVSGVVKGAVLSGKVELAGEIMSFQATAAAQGLVIMMEGEEEPLTFVRRGAPATASSGPAATVEETPAEGPAVKDQPEPLSGQTTTGGKLYRAEYEGWSVRIPATWKMSEREGSLVLGSDSEAGLMVVRLVAAKEADVLRQGLAEDLASSGARFPEPPPLSQGRLPGGKALFTEFSGQAHDGTQISLRAVGVIGDPGTVAVYGITVPGDKFKVMRQRVDAVASSVKFFKPKVSPGRQAVVGEWFSFAGAGLGSSGGSSSNLAFCPDGRFLSSSESGYSGGAGTAGAWGMASQGDSVGRWTVRGDERQGTVTVTYQNGEQAEFKYKVKKPRDGVYFNGRLYGLKGGTELCR